MSRYGVIGAMVLTACSSLPQVCHEVESYRMQVPQGVEDIVNRTYAGREYPTNVLINETSKIFGGCSVTFGGLENVCAHRVHMSDKSLNINVFSTLYTAHEVEEVARAQGVGFAKIRARGKTLYTVIENIEKLEKGLERAYPLRVGEVYSKLEAQLEKLKSQRVREIKESVDQSQSMVIAVYGFVNPFGETAHKQEIRNNKKKVRELFNGSAIIDVEGGDYIAQIRKLLEIGKGKKVTMMYFGHGTKDGLEVGQGQTISAEQLLCLFNEMPSSTVVLNCCYSYDIARAVMENNPDFTVLSTARNGAPLRVREAGARLFEDVTKGRFREFPDDNYKPGVHIANPMQQWQEQAKPFEHCVSLGPHVMSTENLLRLALMTREFCEGREVSVPDDVSLSTMPKVDLQSLMKMAELADTAGAVMRNEAVPDKIVEYIDLKALARKIGGGARVE